MSVTLLFLTKPCTMCLSVLNQQSLIERLELICRQLGMLFTPPTTTDSHMVLTSDMFKVIIVLEGQNGIKDVRVGHQENPVVSLSTVILTNSPKDSKDFSCPQKQSFGGIQSLVCLCHKNFNPWPQLSNRNRYGFHISHLYSL